MNLVEEDTSFIKQLTKYDGDDDKDVKLMYLDNHVSFGHIFTK